MPQKLLVGLQVFLAQEQWIDRLLMGFWMDIKSLTGLWKGRRSFMEGTKLPGFLK
jgi:hypothetical protein